MVAIVGDIFVFRRGAGRRYQFLGIVGIGDEPGQAEVGSPLHQGVDGMAKVSVVTRKQIALPKRVHQPGAAQGPVGPFGLLTLLAHGIGHGPDVAVVSRTPALLHAPVVAGRVAAIVG